MLGLTSGELFVVVFLTLAVVSAPWWPRLGEAIADLVSGADDEEDSGRASSSGDEGASDGP
jgi:hypothetical protein